MTIPNKIIGSQNLVCIKISWKTYLKCKFLSSVHAVQLYELNAQKEAFLINSQTTKSGDEFLLCTNREKVTMIFSNGTKIVDS
jgi:hypothetical protein